MQCVIVRAFKKKRVKDVFACLTASLSTGCNNIVVFVGPV